MEAEPLTPEREVLFAPSESAAEARTADNLRIGDVVRSEHPDRRRGVICSLHEDGLMQVKDYTGSTRYTNRQRGTWERVPRQEQLASERYLSLVLRKDDTMDGRDIIMAMLPPDAWDEMLEDYPADTLQATGLLARYMGLVELLVRERLPIRPVNSLQTLSSAVKHCAQCRSIQLTTVAKDKKEERGVLFMPAENKQTQVAHKIVGLDLYLKAPLRGVTIDEAYSGEVVMAVGRYGSNRMNPTLMASKLGTAADPHALDGVYWFPDAFKDYLLAAEFNFDTGKVYSWRGSMTPRYCSLEWTGLLEEVGNFNLDA